MRIDLFLYKNGLFPSRNKAVEAINDGRVLVGGKKIKPSTEVEDLSSVEILSDDSVFVSNGGAKLKKAIDDFRFDVKDMVFADIGASNGGFTDCLLKNGAKKVYAVDVGECQLDKSLLSCEKVVVKDNVNARYLTEDVLGERVDGVTADVSFISLTYILDGVKKVLKEGGYALLLIKPQFECGREFLNKNGIVKDVKARNNAIKKVYNACFERGLFAINITTAPIKAGKNVEYVILLKNEQVQKFLSVNDVLVCKGDL